MEPVYECTFREDDSAQYGLPTVRLQRVDGTVGWIRIIGADLMGEEPSFGGVKIESGKRYRFRIELVEE